MWFPKNSYWRNRCADEACELGGQVAERLHPEANGKQLLLKMVTCHNWDPQGPALFNSFTGDVEDKDRLDPVQVCQ